MNNKTLKHVLISVYNVLDCMERILLVKAAKEME